MDKDRVEGIGKKVTGSVKEAIGKVTGDNGHAGRRQGRQGCRHRAERRRRRQGHAARHRPEVVRMPGAVPFDASDKPGPADAGRARRADARAACRARGGRQAGQANPGPGDAPHGDAGTKPCLRELSHEHVVVERVAVGRVVDAAPPIRHEGRRHDHARGRGGARPRAAARPQGGGPSPARPGRHDPLRDRVRPRTARGRDPDRTRRLNGGPRRGPPS